VLANVAPSRFELQRRSSPTTAIEAAKLAAFIQRGLAAALTFVGLMPGVSLARVEHSPLRRRRQPYVQDCSRWAARER
jgi:hypothetical protein